tara:strand:+ start:531 stop:872 length:342 start_codon:yes stop_codon:yes gene_type:complete
MKNFNQNNIKKHTNIIILTFIFLFFISSCLTLGKDFPHLKVKSIKNGETTKGDIRKLFGSPWLSGINNGELTWTYGNYDYSLFGKKEAKDLVIQFDDKGIVSTYTYSTTQHDE